MKLFTQAQYQKLRKNGSEAHSGKDHKPVVKWFTPDANATWLVTEIIDENTAFGLCDLGLGYPELGYIDLEDIQNLQGPLGMYVERDLHFEADFPLSAYTEAAMFRITEDPDDLLAAQQRLKRKA